MKTFVERIFHRQQLEKLTREDVESWLRMYLSTFEDDERPPNWSTREVLFHAREMPVELEFKDDPSNGTEAKQVEEEAKTLRSEIESRLGLSFLDGPKMHEFIRINNAVTNHTPMAPMYIFLPQRLLKLALSFSADSFFRLLGFQWWRDDESGIGYWHRGIEGTGLLFIHGLGFGQAPYVCLISNLASLHSGPLILVECPGIGRSKARVGTKTPFPRPDEIAESMVRLKRMLRLQKLHAVGHSLGGMILSSVLKYKPTLVDRVAYVESPVFFFRTTDGWPDIFKQHSSRSMLCTLLSGDLHQFGADWLLSEPWNQHVIHQTIWFWEYVHWETNLDGNSLVVLASEDEVCPAKLASWLSEEYPAVKVATYSGAHGSLCKPSQAKWLAKTLSTFFELESGP